MYYETKRGIPKESLSRLQIELLLQVASTSISVSTPSAALRNGPLKLSDRLVLRIVVGYTVASLGEENPERVVIL
jgi:hypothetical protein